MAGETPPGETPEERKEAELAASEAREIGGEAHLNGRDPSEQAVREAGGGEAEGFEEAEDALIEHASHGDQQSAHAVLHDQGREEEYIPNHADGEPDWERSSEREDDEPPLS
jgi:hypothetical protein